MTLLLRITFATLVCMSAACGSNLSQSTTATSNFQNVMHTLRDPVTSTDPMNLPTGRYVLVDWEIKNTGKGTLFVGPDNLWVQTDTGLRVKPASGAGLPEPQFTQVQIAQQQTARGYLAYDVPRGQTVRTAVYLPPGQPPFLIAEFSICDKQPSPCTP